MGPDPESIFELGPGLGPDLPCAYCLADPEANATAVCKFLVFKTLGKHLSVTHF